MGAEMPQSNMWDIGWVGNLCRHLLYEHRSAVQINIKLIQNLPAPSFASTLPSGLNFSTMTSQVPQLICFWIEWVGEPG